MAATLFPEAATAIAADAIRTDGGTQSRVAIDEAFVDDLVRAHIDGDTFPPLVVFYDGKHYWLADGFHRLKAYLRRAVKEGVEC